MTTANGSDKEYVEQGRRFLNQAREELSRDDLRQASEKGWGATVQLLKAYAEERGLEHDRHAKLFGVIRAVSSQRRMMTTLSAPTSMLPWRSARELL